MKKNVKSRNLETITYNNAGVNIELGDEIVSEISPIANSTSINGSIGNIGTFGGLFDLKKSGLIDPILVSSTDGVGTKLQLAIKTKSYFNIGIDLVAMCVNDVLAQGARPLFFMDYFATNKLEKEIIIEVVKGIAKGCQLSKCALIGGETAEMPGHYNNNNFDLAGFCVGAVERKNIFNKNSVSIGDKVIAISSNGIHSNGFSLIRKIIELKYIDIFEKAPFDNTISLAKVLMEPTLIYTDAFIAANKNNKLKSISHITGGGLIDNPPRSFSKELALELNMKNFELPPVFRWIKDNSKITLFELVRTFNCGIGLLLFVDESDVDAIIRDVNAAGYKSFIIGSMIENKYKKNVIFNGWNV